MPNNSEVSHTLTEKELVKFLSISVDFVRQLRRSGRLPFVKINSRVVYLKNRRARISGATSPRRRC